MRDEQGFVLVMMLMFLTMLAGHILWATSLQIQEMTILKAQILRLQYNASLDKKLSEIIAVLSKNTPLWFNHEDVIVDQGMRVSILIEIANMAPYLICPDEPQVILTLRVHAQKDAWIGYRQIVLLCKKMACKQQVYQRE